ncbi:MAG: SET domain-containing protein-lysine N-methyltransferase [Saprospiraceae bacterium]|nr:SET domain-containing protein-lysine N-methyltransferase [Lewinella sp.]
MLHIPSLYIAPSSRGGRGVFTSEEIEPESIIEISPVIVLSAADLRLIHQTHLHDYYFLWEDGHCAIALGYGSLYNHASKPNADYRMDYADHSITFYCTRLIKAGEEITVNYVAGGNERSELWFKEN